MNFSNELLIKIYQKSKDNFINPYEFKHEINLDVTNKKLGDTLSYLFRNGYLGRGEQKREYCLTKRGKNKVDKILNKKIYNKEWDGLWRIVIFDVPETKRNFRKHIRKILHNLSFIRLQKSVWITPYDVFGELKDLLPSVKRGDWIKLLIVKEISNKERLKKEFNLIN